MEPQYSQAQKCYVVFSINIYRLSHGPATVPCPKNMKIVGRSVHLQDAHYPLEETICKYMQLQNQTNSVFKNQYTIED